MTEINVATIGIGMFVWGWIVGYGWRRARDAKQDWFLTQIYREFEFIKAAEIILDKYGIDEDDPGLVVGVKEKVVPVVIGGEVREISREQIRTFYDKYAFMKGVN